LSLRGELGTMALADILQWVSQGRKTGTLQVTRGAVEKRVSFWNGTVHSSLSNDPRESLGQFLVRERLISEEQLFRTLLKQDTEDRPLGELLVEKGPLRPDELLHMLTLQAEETIYDLFHWPEGHFEFKDGDIQRDAPFPVSLDVTTVIMEGVRRIDEWERMREVIPSTETTLKPLGQPDDPIDHEMLLLCSEGKTVTEIAFAVRRTVFDTTVLLYQMHRRGLIEVDAKGPPFDSVETVVRIQRDLDAGGKAMDSGDFDEALKRFEAVLKLDPLNQHAKKGLVTSIDGRGRTRSLRLVPRNKVPKLTLSLPDLTLETFDPREGFVLSRINGEWDVQSILKICPMPEDEAMLIFSRLVERGAIEFI
jgi:hypothetical protein